MTPNISVTKLIHTSYMGFQQLLSITAFKINGNLVLPGNPYHSQSLNNLMQ